MPEIDVLAEVAADQTGSSRSQAPALAAAPKLAIIMPTYRFDETARQALHLAAGIADSEIRLHIGDNSENPEKHAFLHALAARGTNIDVTCHPTNIGAAANWYFLVDAQTVEYVCLAADDDAFTGAYFRAGLRLISQDRECSGASGLHLGIGAGVETPEIFTPPQRLETSPLVRIQKYHGQNPMAYAVIRTSIIKDFSIYLRKNPIFASFSDYLLTFHLLSIGTYKMDYESYGYIYNNTNWYPPQKFFESAGRFYAVNGLPAAFGRLARLHWAVVNLHFFRSRFRHPSLSEEDASEIAIYLFERLRSDFKRDVVLQRAEIDALLSGHPSAASALQALLEREFDDEALVFDRFVNLVAAFAPDLAARYKTFLLETLSQTPMTPRRGATSRRAWFLPWNRRR